MSGLRIRAVLCFLLLFINEITESKIYLVETEGKRGEGGDYAAPADSHQESENENLTNVYLDDRNYEYDENYDVGYDYGMDYSSSSAATEGDEPEKIHDGVANIQDAELEGLYEEALEKTKHSLDIENFEKTASNLEEASLRGRWVQANSDAMRIAVTEQVSDLIKEKWEQEKNVKCRMDEPGQVSMKCESAKTKITDFVLKKEEKEIQQKASLRRRAQGHTTEQRVEFTKQRCERAKEACKDEEFIPIDGWCNNLKNPFWGSVNVPYRRMIKGKNFYRDRVRNPYTEDDGYPSPLKISEEIMMPGSETREDKSASAAFAFFGQFLAHDLTQSNMLDLNKTSCLSDNPNVFCGNLITKETRKEKESHFFMKSFRTDKDSCKEEKEMIESEQINGYPSYVILTSVYGRLQEDMTKNIIDKENPAKCIVPSPSKTVCGDLRCIAAPLLMAFHILFTMEHNRIVDGLKDAGINADDKTLFQVARSLLIAEYQAIVYGEWLKLLMPDKYYEQYNLGIGEEHSSYDENVDAGIFNEFSAAAFRFGHSMIPGDGNRNGPRPHALRDLLLSAQSVVNESTVMDFLDGAANSPAEKVDLRITDHMREGQCERFIGGADIAAQNIARSRDHGLPPYNKMRFHFGLRPMIRSSREFVDSHAQGVLNRLYKSAKFIGNRRTKNKGAKLMDMWVGGLAEQHGRGGKIGPLFSHVIGTQFSNLRVGDRYFFTNKDNGRGKKVLHDDIRKMIIKRKMGDIFCDNRAVGDQCTNWTIGLPCSCMIQHVLHLPLV